MWTRKKQNVRGPFKGIKAKESKASRTHGREYPSISSPPPRRIFQRLARPTLTQGSHLFLLWKALAVVSIEGKHAMLLRRSGNRNQVADLMMLCCWWPRGLFRLIAYARTYLRILVYVSHLALFYKNSSPHSMPIEHRPHIPFLPFL